MTVDQEIAFLDEYSIEYCISEKGEVLGKWKMSTFAGDDCSEWFSFDEIVDILKETKQHKEPLKERRAHVKEITI